MLVMQSCSKFLVYFLFWYKVIREALEREVEERLKLQFYKKVERASKIILRVRKDSWIKAIRQSREER